MTTIIKQDGTRQKYDERKLVRSLKRAGATKDTIRKIVKHVRKQLRDGMTTKELFRIAFQEYKRRQPVHAPKYDLKNALLRFGKSGFPFEAFIHPLQTF